MLDVGLEIEKKAIRNKKGDENKNVLKKTEKEKMHWGWTLLIVLIILTLIGLIIYYALFACQCKNGNNNNNNNMLGNGIGINNTGLTVCGCTTDIGNATFVTPNPGMGTTWFQNLIRTGDQHPQTAWVCEAAGTQQAALYKQQNRTAYPSLTSCIAAIKP